jgi:hypothetical protein
VNILSEQQARARQLSLPRDGLLTGVSPEFSAELQVNGTFVEYNQQTILTAGLPADYIFCVISGRVSISRRNDDFGKSQVATLGPGSFGSFRPTHYEICSSPRPRRCNCSSTLESFSRKNWQPGRRPPRPRP